MMKRLISAFLLMNALLAPAQDAGKPAESRTVDASALPAPVIERFTRDNPGENGDWTTNGETYRVEFTTRQSRQGQVIVYDKSGKVLRKDSEVQDVPPAIHDFYHENFPGEKLRTWRSENGRGDSFYYSRRGGREIRFSREGRYFDGGPGPEVPAGKR